MKVQSGRAWHADVFVVISQKFRFWLAVWHHSTALHMLFIEKKTRSMGSLAPGSACLRKLKSIVAILRHIPIQFV